MNKYQKVLSPFLGGVFGILLSGYFYYATNEQNYWLLPFGVLIGSSFGYFLGNINNISKEVSKRLQFFSKKSLENWSLLSLLFSKVKKSFLLQMKINSISIPFKKVSNSCSTLFKKLFLAATHPVNKSLSLRFILTIILLGTISYFWCLNIESIFGFLDGRINEANKNSGWSGVFVLFPAVSLMVCLPGLIIIPIMRCTTTYENQTNFFSEYEKYGNKAFLVFENIKNDLWAFIVFQIIGILITSTLMIGIGYIFSIGIPLMILGMLSLIVIEYLNVLKRNSVLTTFFTTLVITVISYLIFNAYFSNPIIIWLTALSTGAMSAVASIKLIEIVSKKETIDNWELLETAMNYFFTKIPVWVYKKTEPFIQKLPALHWQ
jgi:hypothetical protein